MIQVLNKEDTNEYVRDVEFTSKDGKRIAKILGLDDGKYKVHNKTKDTYSDIYVVSEGELNLPKVAKGTKVHFYELESPEGYFVQEGKEDYVVEAGKEATDGIQVNYRINSLVIIPPVTDVNSKQSFKSKYRSLQQYRLLYTAYTTLYLIYTTYVFKFWLILRVRGIPKEENIK